MSRRTQLEGTNQRGQERRSHGRNALLLGTLALTLMACDLFSTADNRPTPPPIVFNTPTAYPFPTDTPIPFQTVEPSASVTDTPMPSSTPSYTDTPTETPGDMPTATAAVEQGTDRLEVEAAGTYAYANYSDASSQVLYLSAGASVVASCVLFVQSPTDASVITAWYRLDDTAGYDGGALYAAADTFMNSDTQQSSSASYDHNLATCPDSPLPPQQP